MEDGGSSLLGGLGDASLVVSSSPVPAGGDQEFTEAMENLPDGPLRHEIACLSQTLRSYEEKLLVGDDDTDGVGGGGASTKMDSTLTQSNGHGGDAAALHNTPHHPQGVNLMHTAHTHDMQSNNNQDEHSENGWVSGSASSGDAPSEDPEAWDHAHAVVRKRGNSAGSNTATNVVELWRLSGLIGALRGMELGEDEIRDLADWQRSGGQDSEVAENSSIAELAKKLGGEYSNRLREANDLLEEAVRKVEQLTEEKNILEEMLMEERDLRTQEVTSLRAQLSRTLMTV